VHQAAAEHKRATRDNIRDLARRSGASDPETFADVFTILIEGTLITRQMQGQHDAARKARPAAEALMERYGVKALTAKA
jgi:hypothetical protein